MVSYTRGIGKEGYNQGWADKEPTKSSKTYYKAHKAGYIDSKVEEDVDDYTAEKSYHKKYGHGYDMSVHGEGKPHGE